MYEFLKPMYEFLEKNYTKILFSIVMLWVDFMALSTAYTDEKFYLKLFSTKKIFIVAAFIALKLCPIIYNCVIKNYNKSINFSIILFVWLFLFESCNISIEVTVERNPQFGATGYFKYFGLSNITEIVATAATVILIYALLLIKLYLKQYLNKRFRVFVCIFWIIKIISIAVLSICLSSPSEVCNACFYSLFFGVIEYALSFKLAKRLNKFEKR